MAKKTGASVDGARPLVLSGSGIAVQFRPEYLDFDRGIRVGNLEENERITRILKLALEDRYRQPFVTERWGRGVFWQWIGYLPRANRAAKPISSGVSFGCSKFFLTVDTADRVFRCGMQVERGYCARNRGDAPFQLAPDWDWHRLIESLKPRSRMARELKRLVEQEGFSLRVGSWEQPPVYFSAGDWPGVLKLKQTLEAAPKNQWSGFQLFYQMPEAEVRASTGLDLVESMLAVFREATAAMNLCMQIELADQ